MYSMGGAHHTFCMEAHMFCMESGSKSGKLWLAPLIAPRPSTVYSTVAVPAQYSTVLYILPGTVQYCTATATVLYSTTVY